MVSLVPLQWHSWSLCVWTRGDDICTVSPSLCSCDWLQQRAHSPFPVKGRHCKKSLFCFIPSLWLPNEALNFWHPEAHGKERSTEAVFHQWEWGSVRHMAGLKVPLRNSLGNHGEQHNYSQQVQIKRHELKLSWRGIGDLHHWDVLCRPFPCRWRRRVNGC